jgi:hypothetical protein
MAVVTLTTPISVGNPEARKRMVRTAVSNLDRCVTLLKLAADSAATSEAEEDLTTSLYWLHSEMERELGTVIAFT